MTRINRLAAGLLAGAAVAATASVALADHSWNGFHWARTSNPFTVMLGDNLTSQWQPALAQTAFDWSDSSVLDTVEVTGFATNPKTCRPTAGRVEICNSKYGANGWLGIASVWSSGGHIVQGTVKLNDTYYAKAPYNTPAWRNLVMCQEVGHTLGLDHQDETFNNANLGTCMDYTNQPDTNQSPNTHDYEMLESIYNSHLDSTTTLGAYTAPSNNPFDDDGGVSPPEWGRAVAFTGDGRGRVFVRQDTLGRMVTTFVFWAPDSRRPMPDHD